MTTGITELCVECFRGATRKAEIQFDASKPLVVVFGENGTGKSTLVDAVDLIANGRIGSLKDRSSAKEREHAPAIGKKPADIKVTLVRGGNRWVGTHSGTKISVSPVDGRPLVDILRRSQLLKLVEAQPAKRYEVLQDFIDVSGVEKSEQALSRAAQEADTDLDRAINAKQNSEQQLRNLWDQNGKPDGSWSAWAEAKSKTSTASLDTDLAKLTQIINAIQSFCSRLADYESTFEVAAIAKKQLERVRAEITGSHATWSKEAPQLITTLESTAALLDAGWSKSTCPVCEQQVEPEELRRRIQNALGSMKALKTLREQEQQADADVKQADVHTGTERTRLLAAARPLITAAKESSDAEIDKLSLDLDALVTTLTKTNLSSRELETVLSACRSLSSLAAGLESRRDSVQRDRNQSHTIHSQYKAYEDADKQIATFDLLRKRLKKAHELVRQKRIEFVQSILNGVSTEAARLYSAIHPGEDTKLGRLELDPARRGSLLQYADFAGHKDVEPQGYFSDSHLDTLGFCYWFALAKRESPKNKILVLDDVFTSVDAAHLGRIVELLDAECDGFSQIIIFTHNRNWRDRYKFNQAAGNRAQLIQLARWTAARGVCHEHSKLELDEIEELLVKFVDGDSSVERQNLASRCGILLEAVLSHLSAMYRCSVPHVPDGDFTLGDLHGGCSKLMKVLEVQRFDAMAKDGKPTAAGSATSPKAAFDGLGKLTFIRNQVGCHFNRAGADLSDEEVEQFAKATVAFARIVVCDQCGEVPRSDKSTHRQCSCKRTRLTPSKL